MPTLKTFTFSLAEIKELWGENVAGKDLYFLGTMTDYYYLETLTGTAVTHIVKDGIKLKVLGKIVRTYKPGVPFNIQVSNTMLLNVSYNGTLQVSRLIYRLLCLICFWLFVYLFVEIISLHPCYPLSCPLLSFASLCIVHHRKICNFKYLFSCTDSCYL